MKFASLIGAVALSLLATAAQARHGDDVSGKWKAEAKGMNGNRQSCDVTLSNREMFGQYQASSFGCSGTLFGISKWRVSGRRVELLNGFGKTLATLQLRGDRLVGEDAKGERVSMHRAGGGTSVPQSGFWGGHDRRDRDYGRDRDWRGDRDDDYRDHDRERWGRRDCIVYGDTRRCVSRADLGEPRRGGDVEILTPFKMRMSPGFGSHAVRTLQRGICLEVEHCTRLNGKRWCRLSGRGHLSGYVAQTVEKDDRETLVFREGC